MRNFTGAWIIRTGVGCRMGNNAATTLQRPGTALETLASAQEYLT
jgi:hypothetical protein